MGSLESEEQFEWVCFNEWSMIEHLYGGAQPSLIRLAAELDLRAGQLLRRECLKHPAAQYWVPKPTGIWIWIPSSNKHSLKLLEGTFTHPQDLKHTDE